ncbi:MAG: RNA polymerase sigma factor, partial [Gammaproteobacteria bacterium]
LNFTTDTSASSPRPYTYKGRDLLEAWSATGLGPQGIQGEVRKTALDRAPHAPARKATDGAQDRMAALLEASARGDRGAFERLYGLASPRLFALCARMLRRHHLAEEVLQETFVQIWHKASAYDARRAAPMTWMGRIARNRAIDVLRRRKFETEVDPHGAWTDETKAGEPDPMEQSFDWQQAAAVRRCLDLLSELQREAVLLAFFRGFTHVELAGVLAVPVGTVKGRIRQGLQRLRECLES